MSSPKSPPTVRPQLSREAVLEGAIALADRDGIHSVTMRKVAVELGVEAMSLYHHVDGKGALLDGMVGLVVAEVDLPRDDGDGWRDVMRARMRVCPAGAGPPPVGRGDGRRRRRQPGHPRPPGRGARRAHRRRLLLPAGRSRRRRARQLHLRLRPPGGRVAGGGRRGGSRARGRPRRRWPTPPRGPRRGLPAEGWLRVRRRVRLGPRAGPRRDRAGGGPRTRARRGQATRT